MITRLHLEKNVGPIVMPLDFHGSDIRTFGRQGGRNISNDPQSVLKAQVNL
jgi:hypothetical protein